MENIACRYKKVPLGNICDANGKSGAMSHCIRPLDPKCKMAGYAYTVIGRPGDNVSIHKAMLEAPVGSVLVVDMEGFCSGGHFGEIMATACKAKGIEGLVIDGSIRDSEEIKQLGFPVFCRGICPNGTTKYSVGTTGAFAMCGGLLVRTGDMVVGGGDGVVVVPQEKALEVLCAAEAIMEKEERILLELSGGKTTQQIYHFQAIENAKGDTNGC